MARSGLPSLAELRRRLEEGGADGDALAALRADPRLGAAALLRTWERRMQAASAEEERRNRLLEMEHDLARRGCRRIAGCDEAGVGPLAGPVVAAAVVLGDAATIAGIDDSKKLDPAARDRLDAAIRARAAGVAVGIATVEEVDALNPYHAGLLAMRRAVEGLSPPPDYVLVDARRIPGLAMDQGAHVKGDARSLSIAAASIVAKTFRDRLMLDLEALYPGYGFARHKGYGTAEHQEALRRLGPCPAHRMSYQAVRELVAEPRLPFA